MAWWIDRPWTELRDALTPRSTLPLSDKTILVAFWEQIMPLACCTSQEYFGRTSALPDGKGSFVMLLHAVEVGFDLNPDTCNVPQATVQQVVNRSGDFLFRMHSMGSTITANDILDAFWFLAVHSGFRGFLVATRSGVVLLTMATQLLEELRQSIESGNMNGAHNDTFEAVWARMRLTLYSGLSMGDGCQWKYWSQNQLRGYLEPFGLAIRFVEKDVTTGDSEIMAFTFNHDLYTKLEDEAMHYMSHDRSS